MNSKFAVLSTFLFSTLLFSNWSFAEISDKQFDQLMGKFLASDNGQKALGKTVEENFKKKQEEAAMVQFDEQFKSRAQVDLGSSPVKGPANAKITIVELSDFECPYCKRGNETMVQLLKAYPNDIRLAFKHLPLPFHKNAGPASRAAFAAGKQGKFWEMHDALFANQQKLGQDFYLSVAKELGLNEEQFKKDMESAEAEAALKADKEIADKNQIQGTPAFFVNGVAIKGAYPLEHFKKVVDKLLAEGNKNA